LSRHFDREPGQEGRHPGDVAVVLARLVGTAQDDIVNLRRRDPSALDQTTQGSCRKIIRANIR
jgi:hypothetical protein